MRFSNSYKKIVGFTFLFFLLATIPASVSAQTSVLTDAYARCIDLGNNPQTCQQYKGQGSTASAAPTTPSTELTCNSLTSCLVILMYYIGPGLAGYVAYVGAYFFSIVVQISLNSTAYALDFLSQGWTIVRDIANMAFIFILIYIAMTVMLQAETAGTIKTLAIVIVIALLVNFSFFFTRVAIDAGNILAVQFYNSIDVVKGPNGQPLTINGVKDLSASLMGASGPQVLLSRSMFDSVQNRQAGGSLATLGLFTFIYLSVAVMLWMLFFAFIQVGIKFMLRIVGLWFLLIASPLAFVARTMKQTQHYFEQWLKYLVEFAFYPAIFLFMFLILTRFATSLMSYGTQGAQGSLLNSISHAVEVASKNEADTVAVIAVVGIRMGFVLALMYIALRVADWIVKEGSTIASAATGRITGAGFGAVGFAGRNTIGRIGGFIPGSIGQRLGRATFDVRNNRTLNSGLGLVGGNFNQKEKKLNFGRGSEASTRPRPTQAGQTTANATSSQEPNTPPAAPAAAAALAVPNTVISRNRYARPPGTTPAANPAEPNRPRAATAAPTSANNAPSVQAASSRIANILRGNPPATPPRPQDATPTVTIPSIEHAPSAAPASTSAPKLPKEMDVSAESLYKIKRDLKKVLHKEMEDSHGASGATSASTLNLHSIKEAPTPVNDNTPPAHPEQGSEPKSAEGGDNGNKAA